MTKAQSLSMETSSKREVAEPESTPWQDAVMTAVKRAGVPKRYRNVDPTKKYYQWAYIDGPVGTGKTHLACRMLRRFIEENAYTVPEADMVFAPRVAFTTVSTYLTAKRDSYRNGDDPTDAIRTAKFLVMDDLGQENPTAWAVEQLFDIVNYRYNEMLPTVFTSQFQLGSIATRLSRQGGREQAEAIASRLMGTCEPIHLNGVDRRTA